MEGLTSKMTRRTSHIIHADFGVYHLVLHLLALLLCTLAGRLCRAAQCPVIVESTHRQQTATRSLVVDRSLTACQWRRPCRMGRRLYGWSQQGVAIMGKV